MSHVFHSCTLIIHAYACSYYLCMSTQIRRVRAAHCARMKNSVCNVALNVYSEFVRLSGFTWGQMSVLAVVILSSQMTLSLTINQITVCKNNSTGPPVLLNIKVVMIVFNWALAHTHRPTHAHTHSGSIKDTATFKSKISSDSRKDEARVFYIFDIRVLGQFW